MKKTLLCALAVITITVWAPASRAVIIDHGNYTTDTTTGLDWLDLTQTVNISKTGMLSMLGAHEQYDGWRYATISDLLRLIWDYTLIQYLPTDPFTYPIVFQEGQIDGLVSLLGSTVDSYYLHYYGQTYDQLLGRAEGQGRDITSGFLADPDPFLSSQYPVSYVAFLNDDDITPGSIDNAVLHGTSVPDSASSYDRGHFLVRQTDVARVPAPGIMMILLPGLALLGFSKRRAV